MKAIRVHEPGPPEVMKLEDVPDPLPGDGELVIRLHAIGINPVETYIRSGTYPIRSPLPYTPGRDGAGVVEATGGGLKRFKVGDRVYINDTSTGSYAEKALCREPHVHVLPDHVTFQQGAAMGVPYATAYRALFHRAHAKPGETLLVHGATGGVGTATMQLAHGLGMVVIGTGGTERGRKMATEQGADHILDHHDPDYLKKLMELTGGRGVDLVLEMLANVNLAKDLTVLAKGGRVVVIGNRGTIEINPRDAMSREASILGMTLMNATEAELTTAHAALGAGLRNRTLRPIIGREIPLKEAPRAHREVIEDKAFGKIVLIP